MFDYPGIVGLAAGTLTTGAFVPQLLHTWRTRSTRDISLPMYGVITAGSMLWLYYGISIHDLPLVAANAASLTLQAIILTFKLRHG